MVLMNPPKKQKNNRKLSQEYLAGLEAVRPKEIKATEEQVTAFQELAVADYNASVAAGYSPEDALAMRTKQLAALQALIDKKPVSSKPPKNPKDKFVPHEVHGRLWMVRDGTSNQDFTTERDSEECMIRINPPIMEDLLQSAPIAITNAALVTALSSYCETKLKAQFATSTKPELYAKLSGVAIGAAATAAGYLGAKYFIEEKREDEEERNIGTYSTPILVGGVVALGIRLLSAFIPNWFANPALPQAPAASTAPAVTGDFLNVSHVPRRSPSRMVVAQPAQRALADYVTVPQIQSAAAKQAVALRSPFSSTPIVR